MSRAAWNRTAAENFEVEQNGKKPKSGRNANNFTIAASVALCDQSAILHDVKGREDASAVALVLGARDWMIRPERVIGSLKSPRDVDHILVTDSPHGINGRKRELQEWLRLFPVIQDARLARRAGGLAIRLLAERITFLVMCPKRISASL